MMDLYRINTVRCRLRGTTVVGAHRLDEDLQAQTAHASHCIVFPSRVLPVEVTTGQVWRVDGTKSARRFTRDGFEIVETRVQASRAELVRPSGEHVVQLMARSPDFTGVGEVTARKLWDRYGQKLYTYLDHADREALAEVIGERLADSVLAGWEVFGASDTVQWLHSAGVDLGVSRKLLRVYGNEARDRLSADPYRALALGMTWAGTDEFARKHFYVQADDPRRLSAAVEAEMYDLLESGHMAVDRHELANRLNVRVGKNHCSMAIDLAKQRCVVEEYEGLYTSLGAAAIERSIVQMLVERLDQDQLCAASEAVTHIERFEVERARELGEHFSLNQAQREAVLGVALHPVLLITGGAGVGKTTVLRAVCHLLDAIGCPAHTLALSGRAAKRLAEATGRKSSTIAGFLANTAGRGQADSTVLIVDEASMLDALLAYRLLNALPHGGRIVFIGDPGQLPPVGPGLTLHALVDSGLAQVKLTEVKRFGGLIAEAAKALRDGVWPSLSTDATQAVFTVACTPDEVLQQAHDLYLADPDNTQILTFNRKGKVSANSICDAVQRALVGKRRSPSAESRPPLKAFNTEGDIEYTGLRLLDRVICTRNIWDEDVQNGSLGQIVKLHNPAVRLSSLRQLSAKNSDEWVHAEVLWDDGLVRPVTDTVLDALELAYAITTHKSQGSQFKRVVVVVHKSRLLDRTMLYTAVTRATNQVVLVGDMQQAKAATEAAPHASLRVVTLRERLKRALADVPEASRPGNVQCIC